MTNWIALGWLFVLKRPSHGSRDGCKSYLSRVSFYSRSPVKKKGGKCMRVKEASLLFCVVCSLSHAPPKMLFIPPPFLPLGAHLFRCIVSLSLCACIDPSGCVRIVEGTKEAACVLLLCTAGWNEIKKQNIKGDHFNKRHNPKKNFFFFNYDVKIKKKLNDLIWRDAIFSFFCLFAFSWCCVVAVVASTYRIRPMTRSCPGNLSPKRTFVTSKATADEPGVGQCNWVTGGDPPYIPSSKAFNFTMSMINDLTEAPILQALGVVDNYAIGKSRVSVCLSLSLSASSPPPGWIRPAPRRRTRKMTSIRRPLNIIKTWWH